MAGIKQRMFQGALGVHTRLKSLPYYTQAYDFAKTAFLRQASAPARQAAHFATAYETQSLREKVILYESFHASSVACGPAAIYAAAKDDPRFAGFQHIWVIDDPAAVPPAIAAARDVKVIDRTGNDYPQLLATAKYVVNNSTFPFWFTRRQGQVYVNTWHGIPLKTMFKHENNPAGRFANSQRNFLQASHILLAGDYASRHLLGAADVLRIVGHKTYEIGTPRLDRTLAARARWQPDPEHRQILFAPTWKGLITQIDSQIDEIETMIALLAQAEGAPITLHIKAHNFNTDDLRGLDGKSTGHLTVKAVDARADINDVMAGMDMVLTDYSSLMFDALAADIPVGLYVPDLETYSATRGLFIDPGSLPLALCPDGESLLAALAAARKPSEYPPEVFEPARAAYFAAEDGQAAVRALDVMLGADTAPAPRGGSGKPLIAMMAGGWLRNGITSSAINLLHNIDRDTYDVAVLTDGVRLDDEAWKTIARIPPDVMQIHRVGQEAYTAPEVRAKAHYYERNDFSRPADAAALQQAMRREARRLLGDTPLEAAIEFSGYRRLWVWIIAMSGARRKIVYQHNDMLSEMTTKHPELRGVFHIYRHFDRVVTVSEETRRLNHANLREYYPEGASVAVRNTLNVDDILAVRDAPELKIAIDGETYTPLSIDQAHSTDVTSLNVMPAMDRTAINFITVGRFSIEKNHQMLLHAFADLVTRQPKARLYMLGEGPLLETTRSLRDGLGLQGRVTIPGFSSQALHLVDAADCFVLPSTHEGQPMVILEALTLGKPVIVTDIPGSRSALDGGYGHIVEGKPQAKSFADAMEAFCKGRLSFKDFDAHAYNAKARADFAALIADD